MLFEVSLVWHLSTTLLTCIHPIWRRPLRLARQSRSGFRSRRSFWLPIAGFAGIAAGAFLKTRTDRAAYLRDERRKVYVAFIHGFGSFVTTSSTETVTALRSRDAVRLAELPGFARTSLIDLEKLRQEVMLIGSPPVVSAAGDALIYVGGVTSQMAASLKDGFDRDTWNELMTYGMRAQTAFIHAAQVDLGLPKDELLPALPPADPALRKKLLSAHTEMVTEALAEERAKNAAPDATPAPSP